MPDGIAGGQPRIAYRCNNSLGQRYGALFCSRGLKLGPCTLRIQALCAAPGDPMSKIRDFVEDQFLIEFDDTFPPDTDLFKAGVMDSFGYIQMIRFLESEFGITFSEAEMTGDVLVSLAQVESVVASKIAATRVA